MGLCMELKFCKFCAYGMFCSSCVGTAWIKCLCLCLQKKKMDVSTLVVSAIDDIQTRSDCLLISRSSTRVSPVCQTWDPSNLTSHFPPFLSIQTRPTRAARDGGDWKATRGSGPVTVFGTGQDPQVPRQRRHHRLRLSAGQDASSQVRFVRFSHMPGVPLGKVLNMTVCFFVICRSTV